MGKKRKDIVEGLEKINESLEKLGRNKMDMKIGVILPPDDKGFTGRECPQCKRYFKVKFGTGLHGSTCCCPYCGIELYGHQS